MSTVYCLYTDWRDRANPPETLGVFEDEKDGLIEQGIQENYLRGLGYGEDEVRVCLDKLMLYRSEVLSKDEYELVMSALDGVPLIASQELKDKLDRILKKHM